MEALEAIYPAEFTKLSETEWQVHLVPLQDGEGDNHGEYTALSHVDAFQYEDQAQQNLFLPLYVCHCAPTVGVDFRCSVGPTYPDQVPEIAIENATGLAPPQVQDLLELAQQTAADNVGMVMGYTIAEAIREWLIEHNVNTADGSMHANMLRRMDENTKRVKKEDARIEVGHHLVLLQCCILHYHVDSRLCARQRMRYIFCSSRQLHHHHAVRCSLFLLLQSAIDMPVPSNGPLSAFASATCMICTLDHHRQQQQLS